MLCFSFYDTCSNCYRGKVFQNTHWRAGASQPSRTTGTIFLSLYLSGRCTYRNVVRTSKYALHDMRIVDLVFLNIRRKQFSRSQTLPLWWAKALSACLAIMPAINVFMRQSTSSCRLPLLSDLFVPVWSGTFSTHCIELKSMFHAAIISWIAPAHQKCTAFTY